jgi:hypothetical protein
MRIVLIPALAFIFPALGAAIACSYWIPDLDAGPVGGLAFFLVCGLVGAAVGLLGVDIYSLVRQLEHFDSNSGVFSKGEFIAEFLRDVAINVGPLLAFAAIVYLLAPAPESVDDLDDEPAPAPAGA